MSRQICVVVLVVVVCLSTCQPQLGPLNQPRAFKSLIISIHQRGLPFSSLARRAPRISLALSFKGLLLAGRLVGAQSVQCSVEGHPSKAPIVRLPRGPHTYSSCIRYHNYQRASEDRSQPRRARRSLSEPSGQLAISNMRLQI